MNAAPTPGGQAFGEQFGIPLPTRYPAETHTWLNNVMALDSTLTPLLTRMSSTTQWICRALAGLLVLTAMKNSALDLRARLKIEVTAGLLIIVMGISNVPRVCFLERLYLIIGGVVMIGNALMTELD